MISVNFLQKHDDICFKADSSVLNDDEYDFRVIALTIW